MFKKIAAFGIPLITKNRFIEVNKKPSVSPVLIDSVLLKNLIIPKVPKVSVLFLPGTGVKPSEYLPALQNLKDKCKFIDVDVNINVVQFTLNSLHRFESEKVLNDVNKFYEDKDYDDIVLIGHSAGGSIVNDIAGKMDKKPTCLIDWCSSFNYDNYLPWEGVDPSTIGVPSITLLAENDKRVPFAIAGREYCNSNTKDTYIHCLKNHDHFSGVRDDNYSHTTWMMAKFIRANVLNSPTDIDRIEYEKDSFSEQYKDMMVPRSRRDIILDFKKFSESHEHYSVPPDMVLTFLYISVPILRPVIHSLILFPSFIFSQPQQDQSYSFSPLPDFMPWAILNSPPLWAKIDGIEYKKNRSRDINQDTFNKALGSVSDQQRQRYINEGKKMVFHDDVSIPLVPGCSLLWIMLPLLMFNKESELIVISPTIDIGSRVNSKLISHQQCVEWILTKSFYS